MKYRLNSSTASHNLAHPQAGARLSNKDLRALTTPVSPSTDAFLISTPEPTAHLPTEPTPPSFSCTLTHRATGLRIHFILERTSPRTYRTYSTYIENPLNNLLYPGHEHHLARRGAFHAPSLNAALTELAHYYDMLIHKARSTLSAPILAVVRSSTPISRTHNNAILY